MGNLWRVFKDIMTDEVFIVATVVAHTDDGGSLVETPGGGSMKVRGQLEINKNAFIRNGVIESEAPTLPFFEIEV